MAIKLTKDQQKYLAVGGVLAIVLGAAYWKLFWAPISKKIADTESSITEISAKIEKATRQAARFSQLEQELLALNVQANEAELRLPKDKSVPEILVTVNTLAVKNRVSVTSFTPGSAAPKKFFTELNYPIVARGSFHSIGKFLASLALEQRIFNVMNVNYTGGGDGELSVSFTLVSYQYNKGS